MRRRLTRIVSLVLAAGLFLTACGDDKPATRTTKVDGKITVFAATSLTAAFTDIAKAFEAAHPGTKVTFNFGASSALSQQIIDGATPDAFASADEESIGKAFEAHALHLPAAFARNRLVIVTKPGNPAKITGLANLADVGVVSLCGAQVPCGAYAAEALTNAGVTVDESHVTRAPNVAAALSAVTDGDAVAAIVYTTDAKAAGERVVRVNIPDSQNVIAYYLMARLKASPNVATARAFVSFVRGTEGQTILRRYGFLKS